jgi:hypothetical protein
MMHGESVSRHPIPAIFETSNSYTSGGLGQTFPRRCSPGLLGSCSIAYWGNDALTGCIHQCCHRTVGGIRLRHAFDLTAQDSVSSRKETSADHINGFYNFSGRGGRRCDFVKSDFAAEPGHVVNLHSVKGTAQSSRRFVDMVGRNKRREDA